MCDASLVSSAATTLYIHDALPCCCSYEVTKTRHTRKLSEEALLGGISSISLVSFIMHRRI